jgi:hypothetical protein
MDLELVLQCSLQHSSCLELGVDSIEDQELLWAVVSTWNFGKSKAKEVDENI